jgi:hypothetical protein
MVEYIQGPSFWSVDFLKERFKLAHSSRSKAINFVRQPQCLTKFALYFFFTIIRINENKFVGIENRKKKVRN